jgi:hypothetical protein
MSDLPAIYVPVPDSWSAPQFQFGQTVYIEGTDNDPYLIVGMRFAYYRFVDQKVWNYTLSGPKDTSSVIQVTPYTEVEEDAIRAEPWPIEGELCPGLDGQPCEKPAAYWYRTVMGEDADSSVYAAYCPDCYARVLQKESL